MTSETNQDTKVMLGATAGAVAATTATAIVGTVAGVMLASAVAGAALASAKEHKNKEVQEIYTLQQVEEKLHHVLESHANKDNFVKGRISISKDKVCTTKLFFYDKKNEQWQQEVITFEKIALDEQHEERLKQSENTLELPFTL